MRPQPWVRRLAVLAVPLAAACTGVATPQTEAPADPAEPVVDPAGGTMLPSGFPVGSAVDAVQSVLPAGVELGLLPADLGWGEDASLALVLASQGISFPLVVVVGEPCQARSPALTAQQAAAVAESVCEMWVSQGTLPVVPAGSRSGEVDPQDAAR
jgi:hypothetical protein